MFQILSKISDDLKLRLWGCKVYLAADTKNKVKDTSKAFSITRTLG